MERADVKDFLNSWTDGVLDIGRTYQEGNDYQSQPLLMMLSLEISLKMLCPTLFLVTLQKILVSR